MPDRRRHRPATLGAALERQRCTNRERQLVRVLELLRRRATAADACGTERAALDRAISDFGRELDQIRSQLGAEAA